MKCVCVLRGVRGGPIYTSGGRFPPNTCVEGDQETWVRLLEMHLDGRSAGPTWPPLVLILLWQADMWALISFLVCIMHGAPVCSARWALLVSE